MGSWSAFHFQMSSFFLLPVYCICQKAAVLHKHTLKEDVLFECISQKIAYDCEMETWSGGYKNHAHLK